MSKKQKLSKAAETLKENTTIPDIDSLYAMQLHAIEFAEYLTDNHKYCEPDGYKDINGKGETLSIKDIYNTFNELI